MNKPIFYRRYFIPVWKASIVGHLFGRHVDRTRIEQLVFVLLVQRRKCYWPDSCSVYTLNFFFSQIDFCVESYWVIESSRSNICKTHDHSHSDTTPLYIYIYIYISHSENFQGEKSSIYKRVIYYFPSRWKIKY